MDLIINLRVDVMGFVFEIGLCFIFWELFVEEILILILIIINIGCIIG